MLKLLVLTFFPVLVSSACNTITEWTCPNSSKCIPNRYKCDNVPDCTGTVGSPDEIIQCSLPPMLSGFGVSVIAHNLQSSNIFWTTQGDRFTNITVNITYTNGVTGAVEATQVYGRPKRCYDMRSECARYEKHMCDIMPLNRAICAKLCEVCRVDTMRKNARFDMMSLLEKKATNIKATAYASNFKGNGPATTPIEVPIPQIAMPVQKLTIEIEHKFMDEVWAILSWNNTGFVSHPNVFASNGSIKNQITRCRVIELSNGTSSFKDCQSTIPFMGKSKKKFYDLKYSTKYAFSVKPVLRYTDEISGPTATVFLTTPAKEESEGGLNIYALSFGISGAVVFLGIVFVSWRKYKRGEGICDCDDDDDDKFTAHYTPGPILVT